MTIVDFLDVTLKLFGIDVFQFTQLMELLVDLLVLIRNLMQCSVKHLNTRPEPFLELDDFILVSGVYRGREGNLQVLGFYQEFIDRGHDVVVLTFVITERLCLAITL
ncbi:hypothetical protein D3C86_1511160 [compost metagenome]